MKLAASVSSRRPKSGMDRRTDKSKNGFPGAPYAEWPDQTRRGAGDGPQAVGLRAASAGRLPGSRVLGCLTAGWVRLSQGRGGAAEAAAGVPAAGPLFLHQRDVSGCTAGCESQAHSTSDTMSKSAVAAPPPRSLSHSAKWRPGTVSTPQTGSPAPMEMGGWVDGQRRMSTVVIAQWEEKAGRESWSDGVHVE